MRAGEQTLAEPDSRSTPGRPLTPLAPSSAAFLGFAFGGLVNAVLIAAATPPWREGQALVHLADFGAFVCVGFAAGVAVEIWARFGAQRRKATLGVSLVFAYGIAWVLLRDDVEHFSQRHSGALPASLILAATLLAISLCVPAAIACGWWLQRSSLRRWAGLGAACGGLLANGSFLPADYFGIHLYLAWASVTLAAGSLSGSASARLARVAPAWKELSNASRIGLAAVFLAGLVTLCWVPLPARVAVSLMRNDGAVFHRVFGTLRGSLRSSAPRGSADLGEWFRSRSYLPPIPARGPRLIPKNAIVILLTVDALRADVINSRQYDRELPTFAKLRDESVWFSEARAAATLTKLSIGALFTGTYFSQQYWTVREGLTDHVLNQDRSLRFTQLLQQINVRTLNFRSIQWIANENGFVRGFDEEFYVPYPKSKNIYTPSPEVFGELLPRIAGRDDQPAFIFSHLADAHAPYSTGRVRRGSQFDRYVSEVQVVDQQLARLLEVINRPGLRERTLLVLSADHGEAFGEHGKHTHGNSLYDETLRVPLLIRLPHRTSRRVDTRVSLLDIAPTILDALHLSTPGHFMGQSLVPFLRGEVPRLTRPIAAETRRIQALVAEDGLKVIVNEREDSIELYNVVHDPSELNNLADSKALLARPLAQLRQFFAVHRLNRPGYEPPYVR